jgi:hypothetical protein
MALLDEQPYIGYPQMGRRRAMPNRDVEMNQGLLRGASYYPTDLLGSPVDLINMALKPLGMGSQKPVMGSDYLQSLAQQYGLSQQPTGSNAENVARLAMSAMNPATGARAVGRAIEPTMQALAPKAAQMTEDYLRSIGGIANIVPPSPTKALPNDYYELNSMVTKAYDNLLKNPNSKEAYEQYLSLRKAKDEASLNNPSAIQKQVETNVEDYKGQHQAPMRDSGKPLHDLTDVYPEDFYSSKAVQYYGTGDPSDYRVINQLQYLRNKPNEPVMMYRAVPKDAPSEINQGDWVTIDRNYAKEHGESALNGDYKIIKRKATAKDLYTNGDSPYEMGYDPFNKKKVEGLLD